MIALQGNGSAEAIAEQRSAEPAHEAGGDLPIFTGVGVVDGLEVEMLLS